MSTMKRGGIWKYGAGAIAITCLAILVMTQAGNKKAGQGIPAEADPSPKTRAVRMLGTQPLHFEANQGQTDAQVKFLSRGNGYSMFLTGTEAVVALNRQRSKEEKSLHQETTVVRMAWKGADPRAKVTGLDPLTGKTNYLIGNDRSKWRTDISSYAKVRYEKLYAGIDLVFYGNQKQLEYDFVVAPGADPRVIRLAFAGEDRLSIDPQGNLVIHTGDDQLVQKAPVIYQEVNGAKQAIAGSYVKKSRHEIGFQVAAYDTNKTLYIDPVFAFSSFLGGNGDDYARGVAVDGSNNIYVAGYTSSTDFPTTVGAYLTAKNNGIADHTIFVAKISPAGALVYATYVGTGNTSDEAYAIAVDSGGNAYITGRTFYPGSGVEFPIVNGFTTSQPVDGAFLCKLNATGSAILYSTVLKCGSSAIGYGIAVQGANAYVAGMVVGDNEFPLWPDGGTNNTLIGPGTGAYQAFIVKIDTATTGLSSLIYATRWAVGVWEYAYAVAVDGGGNAYITGYTSPSGSSARQVLVVKFNPSGGQVYAKTFGGTGLNNDSSGYGIAVDSQGNAYVTGFTGAADFPVTAGAFQTVFQGPTYTLGDAFVAKLDPTGATLLYSTFLGGNTSTDIGNAIAIDNAGNAYIAGGTYSTNFPTTPDAIQPARAGTGGDAFVTVLDSTGTALLYSSYLGGTGRVAGGDKAFGIALDGNEDLIVVGQTDSTDFPLKDAFQGTSGGQFSGFVTKITNAPPPAAPVNLSAAAVSASQIDLAWTDQSTDETGFQIERKTGAGGTYAQIGTPAANATTYSDTGRAAGTTYFYRVRAVNGAANSAYSNEANATTPSSGSPPAAPANLSAAAISASQIDLAWTDQSTDETGFQVERKTGAGGTYAQIGTPAANATAYSDSGVAGGTTYYYRVRAVNGAANSAYSNEANATTSSSTTSSGSGGGGGGGCSISPEGKSKSESPLGTMLALLFPGIYLVVRKTFHRKQILP